jgi:hypothetical protein
MAVFDSRWNPRNPPKNPNDPLRRIDSVRFRSGDFGLRTGIVRVDYRNEYSYFTVYPRFVPVSRLGLRLLEVPRLNLSPSDRRFPELTSLREPHVRISLLYDTI